MASVNKVILIGNLGRDPEVKHLPSGGSIAKVAMATTEKWKDKSNGEMQQHTEWHNLTAFGKLADVLGTYTKKGDSVYVEGRIKTQKWQDKETGADKYKTIIEVQSVQLLGGKGERKTHDAENKHQEQKANGYAPNAEFDDEIPF